jgi:dimethylamine/trimethylamine dehydrogenase
MASPPEPSARYLDTLLRYYEEEISGEAYFYALADHFDERDKMILLAKTERVAAQAIEPLLEKYGLVPKGDSELKDLGQSHVGLHQSYSWSQFMTYVVERYPGYLDDFAALEQMAPKEDLPALNILTNHEVAVIDFAEKELRGDPGSLTPLKRYLE